MTIREEYEAAREAARDHIHDLLQKSESGTHHITDAEAVEAKKMADNVHRLREKAERIEQGQSFLSSLPNEEQLQAHYNGGSAKSGLPGMAGSLVSPAWAQQTKDAIQQRIRALGGQNAKSLLGGTVNVPVAIADTIPLQQAPTNVLQLIDREPLQDGADGLNFGSYDYAVQTVRQNNAAAVADRAVKPISPYDWDTKGDRLRVYAHISENIPERFLEDSSKLLTLISGEMLNGLFAALENDVIAGPAAGTAGANPEAFTGILNTSGIQTVAATSGTDSLVTLSRARSALIASNDTPNAWIMNPLDMQRFTLMRENGDSGALLFNSGRTQLADILGSPVVESNRIPRGTAILGDFSYAKMVYRGTNVFEADKSGDLFSRNLVRFRLEGRYGFNLLRPSSFVKVTLTGSSDYPAS